MPEIAQHVQRQRRLKEIMVELDKFKLSETALARIETNLKAREAKSCHYLGHTTVEPAPVTGLKNQN